VPIARTRSSDCYARVSGDLDADQDRRQRASDGRRTGFSALPGAVELIETWWVGLVAVAVSIRRPSMGRGLGPVGTRLDSGVDGGDFSEGG
jgi:hypothetical protein